MLSVLIGLSVADCFIGIWAAAKGSVSKTWPTKNRKSFSTFSVEVQYLNFILLSSSGRQTVGNSFPHGHLSFFCVVLKVETDYFQIRFLVVMRSHALYLAGEESRIIRVPTHTRKTGNPGKMREVFPVREKSGNFRISPESQGKVREFSISQGKVREN